MCRGCIYYPCLRAEIEQGCSNYKSEVQKELENIDKKLGGEYELLRDVQTAINL